ncbi:MAG: carboxypeptidase regulatory-like domain-containing protein [Acidobacteriota bacterium]|nr:carboxypeptidase regulatory-like domain-containing protein [Acidobacteriota bacterium]
MRSLVPFLLSLLTIVPLAAQAPSASVVGRVVDDSGAVIPGVIVKITNLDTNQSHEGVANAAGDYTVPYLNPGRYSLEARGQGFRVYQHSEFTLQVNQELRLNIKLEVGSTSDTITVTDTPAALNTESGMRGDVTSHAEIAEMPLNGRNFADLAYLTGGVIPRGEGADGQFAVNGARADNISALVDGMGNTQRRNTAFMVSPPLESIQEFKMITSGFSAEYGRFAGGVLSMVTKSGGNRVHGSVYEFLRNDALDARNYFDAGKSKLIQNQFGATVSGPVLLPKLYNGRDKTFFLVGWESLRQISGSTQRGIVPLPEMLKGDFSRATDAFGKPLKVLDPLANNSPFPNNQIPVSRLDPVALNLAAFYPAPNLAGSANNYLAQANSTNRFNNFTTKVDHTLSDRDRLTLSAHWKPSLSSNPFQRSPVAIFGATNDSFGLLSGIRYIHTFTPSLFDEASVSFSRSTLNQASIGSDHDWSTDAGFLGTTKNPVDLGLPYITVSGYIDLGQAYDLPKVWAYNNFQYANSVTWIHGRHTLKFGGDYLHYQYFNHDYADLRGRMTFLGRFTNDPMADFLLGYAQTGRRLLNVGSEYLFVSNYSGFVQDDFKITPSLTLNIGLRYELMKQPVAKYGARSMYVPELGKIVIAGNGGLANFDDLIQQTGLGQYITTASAVGLPQSVVKTNYHDFAPRFGFAWRPFGNGRTVVRGGYGIFYGTDSLYRYDSFSDTYPFVNTQTFSATATNPLLLTVSNPFPVSKARNSGVTSPSGEPSHNPTQYLQSWSLTVERELGFGTVLEAAFAGSKGTHLPRAYDVNQQLIAPGSGFPRPNPAFSSINLFSDYSNSTYNSGTVTLRRRLSRQFFIRAAYVYAKSIDASSNTGGVIAGGFPSAQDSRNLNGERGRSDFDVGHTFAASFIWQPKLSHHFALRDWQLSGTTTAYTGAPFTPRVANFDVLTGGAARPDRIAKGTLPNPTVDRWFDRTAFPPVPAGAFHFGGSGRNILDGPGTFGLNAGLSRRFRFSETKALQFRCETFNLTNNTNFNLPLTSVDVKNGGVITQAKSPRQMQLGLRLEF